VPTNMGQFATTQPVTTSTAFLPADTTVAKSVSGVVNGPYRLLGILVTSDDTAPRNITFYAHTVAGSFPIGSLALPAGTGFAGVKPAEFVNDALPASVSGLDFTSAFQIYAAIDTTITAAHQVTVTTFVGQY